MSTSATYERSQRKAVGLLSVAACFTLMAVLIAVAWNIVFSMRIGPIVAVVDEGAGRGVHSGDLLAVPLVLMGLFVYGEGLVSMHRFSDDRRLRHRSDERLAVPTIQIRSTTSALLAA